MSNDEHVMAGDLAALYWKVFGALQMRSLVEWTNIELSMAQLKLLMVLTFRGPSTISAIADMLGVGLPTASHHVEKLVMADFAERIGDPDDRRQIIARITTRGQETALRLRQGSGDQLQEWLSRLDDEDIAALQKGLRALVKIAWEMTPITAAPTGNS